MKECDRDAAVDVAAAVPACVGFYEVSPLRGFNSMPASLLRSDWVYPSATSWHLTLFAAQTGEDTTDS